MFLGRVALIKLVLGDSQVVLLVRTKGVIDVALQVDGQVRDPEQRSGDVDQSVEQPAAALQGQGRHTDS